MAAAARMRMSSPLAGCRRPSARASGASSGVSNSGAIELRSIGERGKIRDQGHALLRPAAIGHIAHEIGRVANEMVAAAEVLEVVVAAQASDAYMMRPRGRNEAARPANARTTSGWKSSAVRRRTARGGEIEKRTERRGACMARPAADERGFAVAVGLQHRAHVEPGPCKRRGERNEKGLGAADRRSRQHSEDLQRHAANSKSLNCGMMGQTFSQEQERSFMAYASLLEDRSVIAVKGTEARSFLQGLISNDMEALRARQGRSMPPC